MSDKQDMNNTNNGSAPIPKKRGRKSKKDIELEKEKASQIAQNNINVIIEETVEIESVQPIIDDFLKSELECDNTDENDTIVDENTAIFSTNIDQSTDKPVAKKRGRKPKGGKIIQNAVPLNNMKEAKPNIILHLKCSLKDLYADNVLEPEIQGFDFHKATQLTFNDISSETNIFNNNYSANDIISSPKINNTTSNNIKSFEEDSDYDYDENKCNKDNDVREVWKKLKVLEHNLHVNNICDKKSACFWCTYEFDNPPVYIPKHYIKESYHVYGCFCSPECGTAYLMEENIDSSAKFERYHLLNHIYSKIYDYKKNIKPAPNPYYMLDKYYGNLTIQEYRSLLRNERLFLIVDKPLTRILPELHEDNDDFIINNKIIPSNTYQIKKKLQKKQTKTNILSEKFGLNQ